jgi:hypothetical protein
MLGATTNEYPTNARFPGINNHITISTGSFTHSETNDITPSTMAQILPIYHQPDNADELTALYKVFFVY